MLREFPELGAPMRDAQGCVEAVLASWYDISERKRAEKELQERAVQLQRSNRELQDFASVASHDLQEPLRKIQAFGDRLRSKHGASLGEEGRRGPASRRRPTPPAAA